MFSVVLKVAPNIIGGQDKKFVIQKQNVAFDIISDHHGHICVPTHCIPHRRYQDQAKVVVVEWGEKIPRKHQKKLLNEVLVLDIKTNVPIISIQPFGQDGYKYPLLLLSSSPRFDVYPSEIV